MKKSCKYFFLIIFPFIAFELHSREYFIFSIYQDIPMGFDEEVRKNYYVTVGSDQGLSPGSLLNVYRLISSNNPYDNQNRVNFKVKIGELEIIHTEDSSSIAKAKIFTHKKDQLSLEVDDFMIGDHVAVKIKD